MITGLDKRYKRESALSAMQGRTSRQFTCPRVDGRISGRDRRQIGMNYAGIPIAAVATSQGVSAGGGHSVR